MNKDIDIDKILADILKRDRNSNKYDCGSVCVIAGCREMTGAAILCSEAAQRAGAGLVRTVVPASILNVVQSALREPVFKGAGDEKDFFFTEDHLEDVKKAADLCDAAVIGPGLSRNRQTVGFVSDFLSSYKGKVLIDGDALYALARLDADRGDAKGRFCLTPDRVILTPHEGEAARLLSVFSEEIRRNRVLYAKKGAEKYNCTFVLKGRETVVTDGESVYVNKTGNPGMATAGSGDVLAGICGAFFAKTDAVSAACAGAYIHGAAGDICRKELGMSYMTAGDMIKYLYICLKDHESEV